MTEQNPASDPTLDTPPAGGDQDPTPDPDVKVKTPRATPSSSDDMFAAYDTRLARFVGGVHATKTAAKDAAKDRGVKAGDIDVRKV